MTCCSAVFCISRFRYQGIIYLIYAASRFLNRNGNFKAVLADEPIKEVSIAFVKGRIIKLRLRHVKLCSQCACHGFIPHCIHCLKGINMLSFFQSVKKKLICFTTVLCGAACPGKLRVSAAVLLNIKLRYSFVVRISKLDRQFPVPLSRILMICQHCVKVRLCCIPPFCIKGHILRQMILVFFACKMPDRHESIVTIPALQSIALLYGILRPADRILPCLSGNRSNGTSTVCIKRNGQRSAFRNRYLPLFSMGRSICRFHPYQPFLRCKT